MKKLNVVMVTGSFPPEPCGVGGYTARLVTELRSEGANVHVYNQGPWEIGDVSRITKDIRALKPDLVHIQYPTVGFNRSLGPQMLSLRIRSIAPVVTTIHEVSQVHPLRRLSLYPFSIASRALLFSNQYDCDFASRFAPWIKSKSHIVPLGSSIPAGTSPLPNRDPNDVVCFGLIRPQKGIEEFIAAARGSKQRGLPFKFTLIGMQDPRFGDYFIALLKSTDGLGINWEIGMSEAAVASRLARASYAYMPYPDGATERRTSMIALIAQGLVVVTTASAMTPEVFKSELSIAANPQNAVTQLDAFANSAELRERNLEKGRALARRFEWPHIAREHLRIYRTLA